MANAPAKTAAHKPQTGGKTGELPGRCRIGTACYGDAPPEALRLRRVPRDGVIMLILCCAECTERNAT
ncbi:hypothetical protein ABZ671_00675 [Micromonospora sp. NPDC006766]|uniref:hypothetical protein n=1 Tax=Micromonospora sp. NPDC006766 TaxID=3154778 RepID=UPI00340F3A77